MRCTEFDRMLQAELPDQQLSCAQQNKICHYIHLLKKWSQRINLIQTRNSSEMLASHLVDCLHLTPYLVHKERIVDVGSGAGLPGLILAIALPDASFTLLEPIHKKWAFLSTVQRELALENIFPWPERHTEHCSREDFVPYDAAISRATWSVPTWFMHGQQLVKPGGLLLGMEGATPTEIPESAKRYSYTVNDRRRAAIVWNVPAGY